MDGATPFRAGTLAPPRVRLASGERDSPDDNDSDVSVSVSVSVCGGKRRRDAALPEIVGRSEWLDRDAVPGGCFGEQMKQDMALEASLRPLSGSTHKTFYTVHEERERYAFWSRVRGCGAVLREGVDASRERMRRKRDASLEKADRDYATCIHPEDPCKRDRWLKRKRKYLHNAYTEGMRDMLPSPMCQRFNGHWRAMWYHREAVRTFEQAKRFVDPQATAHELALALCHGFDAFCGRYPGLVLEHPPLACAMLRHFTGPEPYGDVRNERLVDRRARHRSAELYAQNFEDHLKRHPQDLARVPHDGVAALVGALGDANAETNRLLFALRVLLLLPVPAVAGHVDAISSAVAVQHANKRAIAPLEKLVKRVNDPKQMDMAKDKDSAMSLE